MLERREKRRRNWTAKLAIFLAVTICSMFSFIGCSGNADNAKPANATASEQQVAKTPKYVFYFIGDGLGAPQRQISEYYLRHITKDDTKKLLMNTFENYGMTTTYSEDALVTDSAAAGTALATGQKTNNAMISQLPDGSNAKTVVEAAKEKGYATGIISTTRLTHATPASFATHVNHRDMENEIAEQFVTSDVNFLAAGGLRHFVPQSGELGKSKRKDDRNLLQEAKDNGYTVFTSPEDIRKATDVVEKDEKVLALLASSHIPYENDRKNVYPDAPALEELVDLGIKNLSKHTEGFLLVVEGGRIDHAAHAHDPAGVVADTLALDSAIAKAYAFYEEHPEETLIVVGGDHETGGLGLGIKRNYFLQLEELDKVKVSTEDSLKAAYTGDREAYFAYIAENLGLSDLTAEEKAELVAAMDLEDSIPGKKGEKEYDIDKWGYNGPVEITTSNIVSERAAISWTTYAHSGCAIPLAAQGVGSEKFSQYIDNTDIPTFIAELMGLDLK